MTDKITINANQIAPGMQLHKWTILVEVSTSCEEREDHVTLANSGDKLVNATEIIMSTGISFVDCSLGISEY